MYEQRTAKLERFIRDEMIEARERGCDPGEVDDIALHFDDLVKKSEPERWRYYESLLDILAGLEPREDWPYEEPSDLDEIHAASAVAESPSADIDDATLEDKMLGAFLGRCAGCMAGKPVEGRPRGYIRSLLDAAGAYPLDGYFPQADSLPGECSDWNPDKSLIRGKITRSERDDDTDYVVMNLHVLSKYGRDFGPIDVGTEWLERAPYSMLYTAERIAYRNCVNGLVPPETATFRNPYREWIGAQIRADVWGYANPGMPARAADMAFRDASLSHTANGIYGEMFFAAAIAQSFVTGDILELINAARKVVPTKSRFSEVVDDVLKLKEKHPNWEDAIEEFMAKYGHYHVVHTLNNAGITMLSLLYGAGDFGKSIGLSVMGGEDTDCNGATCGSIIGAITGAQRIPEEWKAPLNDTLASSVVGYPISRISELAQKTHEIARKTLEE